MNAVGWFEIYVHDIDRAKKFYETVFDVSLEKIDNVKFGIEMWTFPTDMEGYGATGAIAKMDGVAPGTGGTLVYFNCSDCATEESRVADAGGTIVVEKMSIGEHGFITIANDTEGNTIGLHSMA